MSHHPNDPRAVIRYERIERELDYQISRCKGRADEITDLLSEIAVYRVGGSLNNRQVRANEEAAETIADGAENGLTPEQAVLEYAKRNLEAVANWYERQRENAA